MNYIDTKIGRWNCHIVVMVWPVLNLDLNFGQALFAYVLTQILNCFWLGFQHWRKKRSLYLESLKVESSLDNRLPAPYNIQEDFFKAQDALTEFWSNNEDGEPENDT